MGVGYVLFWAASPVYPVYEGARGLSALEDQRVAAGVMLAEGSLITVGFLCFFFVRLLAESERRQALLEQGVAERAAARAVRYGRAPAE
jgi:hypothetical protein